MPNPAYGQTVLSFEDVQSKELSLTITDLRGGLVLSETLNSSQATYPINCDWAPGVYIVNLYDDEKLIAVEKLVVR